MARWSVCSKPGCPTVHEGSGRCPECKAADNAARGTFRQRGYRSGHNKFRAGVLAKNGGMCACDGCTAPSNRHVGPCLNRANTADHWPLSRRDLEATGLDPDDPKHGRPLCHPCHSSHTGRAQPGGWAQK